MLRVANRHELPNTQWHVVEPLLPRPLRRGRPPRDAREMLEAMLWLMRTGSPWRDLPDWYGPWQTVYSRFSLWRDRGVLDRLVEQLQVQLGDADKIDWELWCIDGTMIRAARCAAGAGKKRASQSRRIML